MDIHHKWRVANGLDIAKLDQYKMCTNYFSEIRVDGTLHCTIFLLKIIINSKTLFLGCIGWYCLVDKITELRVWFVYIPKKSNFSFQFWLFFKQDKNRINTSED